MRVQVRGDPAGLDCHQVTPDPVENRLEHCDAFELGHCVVEDEAAGTADRHGYQHWRPSRVQDLQK